MTPADILEQGAELIETHGWTQQESIAKDEDNKIIGVCLHGACYVVAKLDVDYATNIRVFNQAIEAVRISLGSIDLPYRWNDAPGRTAEEVIEKMKQVAKDLRNKANPLEVHDAH
jgi:hypothetical protein